VEPKASIEEGGDTGVEANTAQAPSKEDVAPTDEVEASGEDSSEVTNGFGFGMGEILTLTCCNLSFPVIGHVTVVTFKQDSAPLTGRSHSGSEPTGNILKMFKKCV
jgi:hypothetical protein